MFKIKSQINQQIDKIKKVAHSPRVMMQTNDDDDFDGTL